MLDERPESVAAFVSEQCGEVALCPNCFSPTFPGVHCCYVCMAPIGDYVAWLPYERIWATAWIVWKATWTIGARPIHAIAAKACLVMVALVFSAQVWELGAMLAQPSLSAPFAVVTASMFGLVFHASLGILCVRTIRNVRSSQRQAMSDADDDAVDWEWGLDA